MGTMIQELLLAFLVYILALHALLTQHAAVAARLTLGLCLIKLASATPAISIHMDHSSALHVIRPAILALLHPPAVVLRARAQLTGN